MLVDAVNRLCTFPSLFTHRLATRTNIDIDDALIAEAMAASGLTTKKAVVEEALRRLVHQKQEEQTLALYGTVDWEGDLEQSRLGRANAE
jgi:Arc/MetJ family transcription regulator